MSSQQILPGALKRIRATAYLGMGQEWFDEHGISDKSYQEVVTLLRESDAGSTVLSEFVRAVVRGVFQEADKAEYQKIRLPDGTTTDRASAVRQLKADGDPVTGWGQHFRAEDPDDPKTFETFDSSQPGVAASHSATLAWVRGEGGGMLLLGGVPGTGKTHLAKAAFAYVAELGHEVFYRREIDLVQNLQRAIQNHDVDEVMEEIQTCPWLILDDYGAAASGAWGRGQIDAIIDSRWEKAGAIRTMLTSNLDAAGMQAQSPRIWSRLSDRTRAKQVDTLGAEDYRQKKGS